MVQSKRVRICEMSKFPGEVMGSGPIMYTRNILKEIHSILLW